MSSPPSSSPADSPPYYILVSQTPLPTAASATGTACKTFSHPIIQYHYADDLPHALLPQSAQEHVLVLDYNPTTPAVTTAQSLSTDLAVLGVKVTDAPAASSTTDDAPIPKRNGKIYVIETTAVPAEMPDDHDFETVQSLIAEFKQRNAILRAALEYPDHAVQSSLQSRAEDAAQSVPFPQFLKP